MKPTLIVVFGRRWTGGPCSLHDAEIIVTDGKETIEHRTPYTYGYGNQYRETAAEWLEREGLITRTDNNGGAASRQPLYRACEDAGIRLICSEVNVEKRSDLKSPEPRERDPLKARKGFKRLLRKMG